MNVMGYNAANEAKERQLVLDSTHQEFPITGNCDYDKQTYARLQQIRNETPVDSAPRIRYRIAYDQVILEFQAALAQNCGASGGGGAIVVPPDPATEAGATPGIMTWITANPVIAAGIAAAVIFIIVKANKKGRK